MKEKSVKHELHPTIAIPLHIHVIPASLSHWPNYIETTLLHM